MQIKYLGGEKFEIRTKESRINLGAKVSINDFVFPGPGEYEKNGVFLEGIPNNGNVIYLVRAEEIRVCYLGKISSEIKAEEIKEIGDVDILMVPLGEEGTLSTTKALALVSKIDPRMVIPMLYSDLGEFKKMEGISDGEMEILKIKKSELPEEDRKIVILTP